MEQLRVWNLLNRTTKQTLKGQFAPEGLTKTIDPKWAVHTALSRTNEIQQFISQGADTLTFQLTMHDKDATNSVENDMRILQSWARPDPIYNNRPPVLSFWVGNCWELMDCTISALGNIRYARSNSEGALVTATAQITLRQAFEFSIDSKGIFETRYHRAMARDYYELLAWREYKSPILGDIIRKDHPSKPELSVGDVVRLPSVEAVRRKRVEPNSLVLKAAYGKLMTPTKERRLDILNSHSGDYTSHTVTG